MDEESKVEVETEPEPELQLVKCPWCGEELEREKYSDHLEDEHYKTVDGKRTGPYPAGVKKNGDSED